MHPIVVLLQMIIFSTMQPRNNKKCSRQMKKDRCLLLGDCNNYFYWRKNNGIFAVLRYFLDFLQSQLLFSVLVKMLLLRVLSHNS